MNLARHPAPINNRKIRIALLGCGRIARNHLGAIAEHKDNLERVGLCDNYCDERLPKGTEVTCAAWPAAPANGSSRPCA